MYVCIKWKLLDYSKVKQTFDSKLKHNVFHKTIQKTNVVYK